MINIKQEEKERCKSDPIFLLSVLEKELGNVRDDLEMMPLERIAKLQGRADCLRDVINLLRRA